MTLKISISGVRGTVPDSLTPDVCLDFAKAVGSPWFNTNNFWFTIQDLLNFNETLPFVLAEKTISEGNVIQIERFACDVHLPSRYLVIERNQRFWPIKRYVDALLYQDPAADAETYTHFKNLLESSY